MIIHCGSGGDAHGLFESASGGDRIAYEYTRRGCWGCRRALDITANFGLGVILVDFVSFFFLDNIYGLDTYMR